MRMKQLTSRAKKYLRTRKPSRMRNAIGGLAIVLVLMIVVGVAMVASPAHESAIPQAQRQAENKKAQLELQSPEPTGSAAASSTGAVVRPASATITGCLQRRDEGFRLKDASGDAPRTRSWKSGFLKKGTPPIDVVDASNRLKLNDHVGQRVSLTGVLVDREMRARSLQRVAAACN